jgi:hypothetical protein
MKMLGSSGGVKGQYQNYIAKISLPRDLCHLFSRTRPDCLDLPGSPQDNRTGSPQDNRTAWIYQVAHWITGQSQSTK